MPTTYPKWQDFMGGTLDQTLPAASTVVTDGVTTNTSTTITSATAAFVSATDVGCTITGTGIPANATIASVTNSTTAVLSAAATATGTAITFTINRHLTMRSAALAAMVAVAADDYMKVVLDPDGIGGAPEIVYVSAHTAAATTATIVRGQEGTTARAHLQDVPWVHAVTAATIYRPHKKVNRATGTAMALLNTGATWADLGAATNGPGAGGFDLALVAQVGDTIEYTPNFLTQNQAIGVQFDVATIVSAAVVNYFSSGTGTSSGGVYGWEADVAAVPRFVVGGYLYTVQAGDLSSGLITMRMMYLKNSATARSIYSTSTATFQLYAKNIGPGA